jgi:hypothetical protein
VRIDLQDLLLISGIASVCAGVGFIYRPASLILFGSICLASVILIERSKPDEKALPESNKAIEEVKIKR